MMDRKKEKEMKNFAPVCGFQILLFWEILRLIQNEPSSFMSHCMSLYSKIVCTICLYLLFPILISVFLKLLIFFAQTTISGFRSNKPFFFLFIALLLLNPILNCLIVFEPCLQISLLLYFKIML